jgi:hypothetical protein
MPPPAPVFLPSNRRGQRLNPTRYLKSRELWNQVRFHASASRYAGTSNHINNGGDAADTGKTSMSWWWSDDSNNLQWAIALLRAILYEIQPFRIQPTVVQLKLYIQDGGWKQCASTILSQLKCIVVIVLRIINCIYQYLRNIDIRSIQSLVVTHKTLLAKSFVTIFALRLYYRTVLYLHDLLAAGPLVIIVTLFILLYTIGLGDNTGASSGIPSAYSVFNRGVRRILGTVDGEELARQFAGGMAAVRAAGGGGGGGMMNHRNDGGVGGIWMHHEEERNQQRANEAGGEDDNNLVNERRRQRRLERLQQQQRLGGDEEGRDHDVPRRQVDDADEDNDLDDDDDDDDDDDGAANVHHVDVVGVGTAARTGVAARKSGKKARRKNNLEKRREIQRQRQVAATLGIGDGMEEMLLLNLDEDDVQNFDD